MSEEELVRDAKKGQASAYAALLRLHSESVRRFVVRLCLNTAIDPDDIVQDAFVVAWERIGRLNDLTAFKGWVCQIAYRRFIDAHRSGKRRAKYDAALDLGQGSIAPEHDVRIDLNRAIAQLHPEQRAVVALCLGEGLSHTEAATALKIPIGTVKSHVSRARSKLAGLLEEAP